MSINRIDLLCELPFPTVTIGAPAASTAPATQPGWTIRHAIRKITPAGAVTTLAGTAGVSGSVDGIGMAALFNKPGNITVDASGNLYVADTGNHTIRKVTPAGAVTLLAGTTGTAGSTDASGAAASFNFPSAITVDGNDDLYVSELGNHVIRKVTQAGVVTTIAGVVRQQGVVTGSLPGSLDGPGGITPIDVKTFALTSKNGVLKLVLP